jgi:alpha-tubulin suppressor-like RCC1 family protein
MRSKWFVLLPALASLALSACDRDPTRTTPEPVEPVFGVLSAGVSQTCAVAEDGTGYCWGSNGAGRLGTGDSQSRAVPTPVTGGHRFSQISTLFYHSCGLTVDGTVYCWGSSSFGQAGNPPIDFCGYGGGRTPDAVYCVLTPTAVAPDVRFTSVGTGMDHTCALAADGRAYCWGSNASGQLGDGSGEDSMGPVPVAGGHTFASLAVGPQHTCGVATDGRAYCWGAGDRGQLGHGAEMAPEEFRATPVAVSGGLRFERLGAAYLTTCGVTGAGAAYCWGFVGFKGDEPVRHLEPARLSIPAPAVAFTGSLNHACAMARDGALYCWGSNRHGELAEPVSEPRWTFAPAAPELRFRGVSVGSQHTCGVTLAGAAVCWGRGNSGQLGDGAEADSHVPVIALEGVAVE